MCGKNVYNCAENKYLKLSLNIIEKIQNIFENDTECEHDNMEKFRGKNK